MFKNKLIERKNKTIDLQNKKIIKFKSNVQIIDTDSNLILEQSKKLDEILHYVRPNNINKNIKTSQEEQDTSDNDYEILKYDTCDVDDNKNSSQCLNPIVQKIKDKNILIIYKKLDKTNYPYYIIDCKTKYGDKRIKRFNKIFNNTQVILEINYSQPIGLWTRIKKQHDKKLDINDKTNFFFLKNMTEKQFLNTIIEECV
jgi:hypothetical protein